MLDFLVHLVGYMLIHLSNGKSLNLFKVILMCLSLFNGRLLQDLLWIFLSDTIDMIGRCHLQPESEMILKKHRVTRDDRRPHYLVNALKLTLVHGLIILLNPALIIHHCRPHPVWRYIIPGSPLATIQGTSGRVRIVNLAELDGPPERNRLRLQVAPLRVPLSITPILRGSPVGHWCIAGGLKVALAGFLLDDLGQVLGGHLEGVTEWQRQQVVFRALLVQLHELLHEVLGRRTSLLLASSHRD